MLPGPYTTKTVKEAFISGTVPTQVDNTKVPMDVEATTGMLWSDGCQGVKETRGFLDLSKVDAGNATWQKYDAIWIDRARKGVGRSGGPNGGPTAYFYYQSSWGAPFAPTEYCTGPVPTPSPSGPPVPTPTTQPTAPIPQPSKTPKHRLAKRRARRRVRAGLKLG
jgi:hypothetical protein